MCLSSQWKQKYATDIFPCSKFLVATNGTAVILTPLELALVAPFHRV